MIEEAAALLGYYRATEARYEGLALFPGSSQFSNVARRKRREPGKIYHVNDVGWRGLGRAVRARSYASTVKLGLYEYPRLLMVPLGLLQTERARRSLDEERRTYVWPGFDIDGRSCARRSAKSPPPYVIHVINFTRLPPFPACNIGKSRGAWERG